MTWRPNLDDVNQRRPTGRLLSKAVRKNKSRVTRRLEDSDGVFACVTHDAVVCAKREPYGHIVSCHKRAVAVALNEDKPIRMWIESAGRFYDFDAREVMAEGEENYKGEALMLNFSIKKGAAVNPPE